MISLTKPTEDSRVQELSALLTVGRPNILDKAAFLQRVEQIIDNKWLSNDGPFVRQLESLTSKLLDVPYVVAVANATLGLELLLEMLPEKGEVILPSFTFVATVHAVMRLGHKPVFCDVRESDGLMDPKLVETLIGPDTVAILPVNVYGNVCDPEALQKLASEHSVKLFFDSAHTLGVKHNGRPVGKFGDAEVFSLHATKFINGFEGGLITTCNEEIARRMGQARNFGFVNYDQVDCIATNAKLSEIHAAMAVTNLEHVDEIIAINRRNYEAYKKYLPKALRLIDFPSTTESNYQYVVAVCPEGVRDGLVEHLKANKILARKYFYPGVHRMKPYADMGFDLPVTESLSERVICLPTGQDVDSTIIEHVCSVINSYL